jgi:outer membrane protein assembly factor BamB
MSTVPVLPAAVPVSTAGSDEVTLGLLQGFRLEWHGGEHQLPLGIQRLLAFLAVHNRPLLRLFVAGNLTTINGTSFAGSVRAFNPADGSIIWERGLTGGPIMGTPTLNGSGVLAAGTYNLPDTSMNAVYLLASSNGNILATIPQPDNIVFAQPVFAGNHLFVANAGFFVSQGKLTAFIPSALKASK